MRIVAPGRDGWGLMRPSVNVLGAIEAVRSIRTCKVFLVGDVAAIDAQIAGRRLLGRAAPDRPVRRLHGAWTKSRWTPFAEGGLLHRRLLKLMADREVDAVVARATPAASSLRACRTRRLFSGVSNARDRGRPADDERPGRADGRRGQSQRLSRAPCTSMAIMGAVFAQHVLGIENPATG